MKLCLFVFCQHHAHIIPGDNTPSPNSYTLPSLLGSKVPNKVSSAAYSMAARATTGSFSEDLAKTPGPGRYNAVRPSTYVSKAPAYSMLGRSYMPGGTIMHVIQYSLDACTLDTTA